MSILSRIRTLFRSKRNRGDDTFPIISEDEARSLVEDRIEFKFFSAEYHLSKLRDIERNQGAISSSFRLRVRWEVEIESLLAQLIGTSDALLVKINEKLNLGLPLKDVSLGMINNRLNARGNRALLADLNRLMGQRGSWLRILNDLRTRSMHKALLSIKVAHTLVENANTGQGWSEGPRVTLITDPPTALEVIPYFENSIRQMRALIEDIKTSEPLLRT
ncbi:hypothetical protein BH18THE2_BH18THE2_40310 [soil metagenome]